MTLRLVIPAYNEALNLPALCRRIRESLSVPAAITSAEAAGYNPGNIQSLAQGRTVPYRLYIVNDGSRDATAVVAEELAREFPITVLTHSPNRGVGQVFLTGFRAALRNAQPEDVVAVLEGDGTSDPALLPDLVAALDGSCDVAIASRYVPGGAYRHFPLKRFLLSHAANLLLRWVCRMRGVRDYTIFFRAYRAEVLRRALEAYGDDLTSVGGFACNAEILLRMRSWARDVREIPFVYDYSRKKGKSGMRIADNIGSYFKLFRVFFRAAEAGLYRPR